MAYVIAQVTLNRDSMLPVDLVTNTWHFESDTPPGDASNASIASDGPGLISRLGTFYAAIGLNLSSVLNGTGTVRLYNHADAKPRVPKLEASFNFTPSTTSYPSEVALCLSFRAPAQSGIPAARRRGRVFLGPLATIGSNVASTTRSDSRPDESVLTAILNAAETMATGGAGAFRLAVFSPTIFAETQSLADAYNDAAVLWMDDAFDTMRSRGALRTKRLRVLVPGAPAQAGVTDTPAVFA